jgi:hypothetical protein
MTSSTAIDLLADSMELAIADVGDLIFVFQSGAYGLTASPATFLSHSAPKNSKIHRPQVDYKHAFRARLNFLSLSRFRELSDDRLRKGRVIAFGISRWRLFE